MKYLILALAFLLTSLQCLAQSAYRNTEKYWWYRYRLVNDFMKIGDQCGESIPARQRYIYYNNEIENGLHWGDATQHLGNYILMLGGEYRMLKDNGFDTKRTTMELYYALEAFNRLDRNAEEYCENSSATYPCKAQGKYPKFDPLNGFFIRDDVSMYSNPALGYYDFVEQNHEHFNRPGIHYLPANSVTSSDRMGGVSIPGGPTSTTPSGMPGEVSQDQMVQLYGGMGMVTRLVDNTVSYNGHNLVTQAGTTMFRMYKYVPDNYNNAFQGQWVIINPVTGHCVGDPTGSCNAGGAEIGPNAVGACKGFDQSAQNNGVSPSDVSALINTTNMPGYGAIWQLQQFATPSLIHDLVYADTYTAFANNWKYGIYFLGHLVSFKNSSWDRVKRHAVSSQFTYPHTPLEYRIVSGPGTGQGIGFDPHGMNSNARPYSNLFDGAPFCGTHNYMPKMVPLNPNNYQQWGDIYWSNHNNLTDGWGKGKSEDNGDFNNIDYMAVFNLYNLCDKDYLSTYFNSYYQENFNRDFPSLLTPLGTTNAKLQLNYLEYLSLKLRVSPGGDIAFRGAKVIDILPGFEAKYGSNFKAYVQDYSCMDESYYYAQVTKNGKTYSGRSTDENATSDDDTTGVTENLDYSPFNDPYTVVPIPGSPDWSEEQDTVSITDEQQQEYIDHLVEEVNNSGNESLIAYLNETLLPAINNNNNNGTGNRGINSTALHTQAALFTTLYPNPNTGRFTVILPMASTGDIKIFDVLGKLVYERLLVQEQKIFIDIGSSIAPGNYSVQIQTERGREIKKMTIVP